MEGSVAPTKTLTFVWKNLYSERLTCAQKLSSATKGSFCVGFIALTFRSSHKITTCVQNLCNLEDCSGTASALVVDFKWWACCVPIQTLSFSIVLLGARWMS